MPTLAEKGLTNWAITMAQTNFKERVQSIHGNLGAAAIATSSLYSCTWGSHSSASLTVTWVGLVSLLQVTAPEDQVINFYSAHMVPNVQAHWVCKLWSMTASIYISNDALHSLGVQAGTCHKGRAAKSIPSWAMPAWWSLGIAHTWYPITSYKVECCLICWVLDLLGTSYTTLLFLLLPLWNGNISAVSAPPLSFRSASFVWHHRFTAKGVLASG